MTFLAGVMAHEESRHKSERVGLAHDRIREAGALIGRPPFGYTTKGKKYGRELVPTEAGRKYVPEIFARVIKGDSLATIAAWLNAEGVKLNSRKGSLWWPRSLGALVRNPTYMGHRVDS
jgi:DNA invertase Pin-like site-specific DNA recombinase